MATFDETVIFEKQIILRDGFTPGLSRANLAQDTLKPYTIPWTAWRIHDALASNLPGTSASANLGLIGGTFASASPSIQTSDLQSAGATSRYARAQIPLPAEYDDGETVVLRFHAGMVTTIADNTCTLDVQAYETDEEVGISADLCATGATTMNSLVFADIDFTITAAALVAGDLLDVRILIACNDAAASTAVLATIGAAQLLCDIKG